MTNLWRDADLGSDISEEEFHQGRVNALELELERVKEEAEKKVSRSAVDAEAIRANVESARASRARQETSTADDRTSCTVVLFALSMAVSFALMLVVAWLVNHGVLVLG